MHGSGVLLFIGKGALQTHARSTSDADIHRTYGYGRTGPVRLWCLTGSGSPRPDCHIGVGTTASDDTGAGAQSHPGIPIRAPGHAGVAG